MPKLTEDFLKNRIGRQMAGVTGDRIFRDDKVTGFQVRARRRLADNDSITLTFFFEYQIPGSKKRKKLVIGPYPTFSADDARERASEMARQVKDGRDPATVRAEAIAEEAAKLTIEEAWKLFDDEHISLQKPNTQKDYRGRYRRIIEPHFRGRHINSISRANVLAMPAKLKDKYKRIDINRAISVLSAFMTFAMDKEWRDNNPCIKVKRFKEQPCETWLDEDELPKFVAALVKVEGPLGDLLRFIAVTGWRVSAARLLRFDQVDLSRLEVRLEDSGTKKHATALSSDAATLIARQKHRVGYVFSRKRGTYPIEYNAVLWKLEDVCKDAGVKRITPHTLRRTIATHSALAGANVAELMQSYGWTTPAMALRYVKRSESLAKKGVERGASIVNVFQKPAAEVIPIR